MMYLPCFPNIHVLELLAVGQPVPVVVVTHDEEVVSMVKASTAYLRILVIEGLLLEKDPDGEVCQDGNSSLLFRPLAQFLPEILWDVGMAVSFVPDSEWLTSLYHPAFRHLLQPAE